MVNKGGLNIVDKWKWRIGTIGYGKINNYGERYLFDLLGNISIDREYYYRADKIAFKTGYSMDPILY